MNKEDKDILSGIANEPADTDDKISAEDDDVLVNGLFGNSQSAPEQPQPANPQSQGNPVPRPQKVSAPNGAVKKPQTPPQRGQRTPARPAQNKASATPLRTDARYSMTPAEIETLASAAEDAVADGRFGAALDSVFFTAGAAREALREKLNIRIPIGSSDTDLPVISAAALIESYLEHEDINGADIEEKLRLIIESSEDENRVRPSADQVELRVFECVLILCVQAEQCGKHPEIKALLYGDPDSFLRDYLTRNIDEMTRKHRKELKVFSTSVKLQSRAVSAILDEYMEKSKFNAPFPVRFFAESKPVLITSIIFGVLCLFSVIMYIVTYGNFMSFIATDSFLISLVIVLEVMFCAGLLGISWLVYIAGESPDDLKK